MLLGFGARPSQNVIKGQFLSNLNVTFKIHVPQALGPDWVVAGSGSGLESGNPVASQRGGLRRT